jgi:transcriptional regulator with XRE-family HTH domain
VKTTEQKEKFVELRAKNWSYKKIAKQLGISKPTLIKWSKELNQKIANMKAIELEAIQEKYYMQKKQKIEIYGQQLEKIKEELEARLENNELKDVKTEQLFKLFFEYMDRLEFERVPVEFIAERSFEEMELDNFTDRFTAS